MSLREKLRRFPADAKRRATLWLRQGVSPRRLALTLAIGFAVGCIPMVGVPTVLCAVLALGLRLNLPAIQAANYAAMPLQFALFVPFVRLGRWLVPAGSASLFASHAHLHLHALSQAAAMAGQVFLAWLLVAVPAVALMTAALTRMFKRIPACDAPGD
jgi:uncharacterized protein (DUF2062 family)